MRKSSMLFEGGNDMASKDGWDKKYNPHKQFDINVDVYDMVDDYLDALRERWKARVDPLGECDEYIDISKYNDFEAYEKTANMCLEHLEWLKVGSEYEGFDVQVNNYKTEDDYLDALTKKITEKYDPDDEFYGLDPLDYESPDEYQCEMNKRKHWRQQYDPSHQYPVDPCHYYYEGDYVEAINEWKNVSGLDAEKVSESDNESVSQD